MNEKKQIGLVGPSGVGKGYAKNVLRERFPDQFVEPIVATTRDRRSTDGDDRLAGLSVNSFLKMVEIGEILFPHQPFSNGSWYGFLTESLYKKDKKILTEVHIDNVLHFREHFGESLALLGILADQDYLAQNIENRGDDDGDRAIRLLAALTEIEHIQSFYAAKVIDEIVKVSHESRSVFGDMMVTTATALLSLN